jgi:hypothetical protein
MKGGHLMQIRQGIIEHYLAADEEERLAMFLHHRDCPALVGQDRHGGAENGQDAKDRGAGGVTEARQVHGISRRLPGMAQTLMSGSIKTNILSVSRLSEKRFQAAWQSVVYFDPDFDTQRKRCIGLCAFCALNINKSILLWMITTRLPDTPSLPARSPAG